MEDRMKLVDALDLAIKKEETGTEDGVYSQAMPKRAYMSRGEWLIFKDTLEKNPLQPDAYEEFKKGCGGELVEKNGRPPKMASYGSSSRMIYKASESIEGFHYEKQLTTTVGGKANLDGYYVGDGYTVFVEAKCHEPYTHANIVASTVYGCLYSKISKAMKGELEIEAVKSECGKYLNVNFFAWEKDKKTAITRFDLKQMICHLLAIGTDALKNPNKYIKTKFVYFLYDPTKLAINEKKKGQICEIYERTVYECSLINFEKLYRTILVFLNTKYEWAVSDETIDRLSKDFSFTRVSQEGYLQAILS